jgi:ParB family chromosome partitioning protein
MAKKALGKGLGALIGRRVGLDADAASPAGPAAIGPGDRLVELQISDIVPSSLQPRKDFRDQELDELASSLNEHGLIQPLVVRRRGGTYELIAGERRWRAAQRARLPAVPAIVRQATDREALEMALVENLQRSDLNPVEEAQAYSRLAKEFDLTQEQIAQKVGKNRATVANMLRLLELHPDLQDALAHGRLSTGHAKVLLKEKDPQRQRFLGDQVIRLALTVRATEALVDGTAPGGQRQGQRDAAARPAAGRSAAELAADAVAARLRSHLSTKVSVHHGLKRGRIEIEYYGNDDLDRILTLLGIAAEEAP